MIRAATFTLTGLCLCSSLALYQPVLAADQAIAPAHAGAPGHSVSLVMQGLAPNARDGYTPRAIRISYDPASLSSPGDMAKLHQRIEAAARALCRYNGLLHQSAIRKKIAHCERTSISEALSSLEMTN